MRTKQRKNNINHKRKKEREKTVKKGGGMGENRKKKDGFVFHIPQFDNCKSLFCSISTRDGLRGV